MYPVLPPVKQLLACKTFDSLRVWIVQESSRRHQTVRGEGFITCVVACIGLVQTIVDINRICAVKLVKLGLV